MTTATLETILFCCDHCDHEIKLSADLAGRRGKCPSCREVIRVPGRRQREESPGDRAFEAELAARARAHDLRTIFLCSVLGLGFLRFVLALGRAY
jgi:hypothetical protein